MMMVAAATVMAAGALQRRLQFAEADRAVAIGIELVEDVIGLRQVGTAGAERVLEFALAQLSVAIAIDLGEQILQGLRGIARCAAAGGGRRRRLALRRDQRAHGLRRNLRNAVGAE